MNFTRSMGLDVGSHTIGVAISDLLGITAQGLETVKINEEAGIFGVDKIVDLIKEHKVQEVIIGLPKNMNNTIGPRALASQAFGEKLQAQVPNIKIIFQDERLTTSQAQRFLIDEGNVSRKKRKKVVDKIAAVIILQQYLDSQKRSIL